MKRLLALLLLLLGSSSALAQNLNLLTNLHPRPQVSYLTEKGVFNFANMTKVILVDSNATTATLRAVAYFERELQNLMGTTIEVTTDPSVFHQGPVIIIGEQSEPVVAREITKAAFSDSLQHNEGYILDIVSPRVLLAGFDSNGVFNGISTLVQILKATKQTAWVLESVHINDWPDYPLRWVFSMHNMMVLSQVSELEAIEDSMAAHKLNGLQQNDFKYSILDWFDSYYYSHVDSMRVHAEENNIEVIPGVASIGYSQGELIHDPDMAEGFPTVARYVVESDTGRLIGDPRVTVPNGNFENANGSIFPGWGWVDTTVHVDNATVHNGQYSARVKNFTGNAPNGRFIKMLTCSPHHGYRMSAWVKTQGFRGEFNLLAIGFHGASSRALTYTQFSIPPTADWQQANVIFNTLDYDSVYVYCGVWSGSAGTIWMDDYKIEDAGMVNILRRSDQLPTVTGPAGRYTEGKDYAKLVDSIMETSNGSYTWHQSPTLRLQSGSKIHNGDTVQVSFIRANPVLNYPNGDGSTMVCVSEDTLYSIIHNQVRLVDSLLHKPNRYLISHDEIRQMNWDSACNTRHLSAAQLLADNVRKCDSVVEVVHPSSDKFDWSDMFDSLHNAYNNYYLVNGDLTGDWNLIPKDLTIINWNAGVPDYTKPWINNRKQSLKFFASKGFSQMTSPYYDEHDTKNIRAWRDSMEGVPNMRGMMYTTWASDYSFLTPFADYAWSAGPMIVHQPAPLAGSVSYGQYLPIDADVFPDPYDVKDQIDSVFYVDYHIGGGRPIVGHVPMVKKSGSTWEMVTNVVGDPGTDITYVIVAKNTQGITRKTPRYLLFHVPGADAVQPSALQSLTIAPNPATDHLTIQWNEVATLQVTIINALGVAVRSKVLRPNERSIDTRDLPAGAYKLQIKDGAETHDRSFVIVR